MTSSFLERAGIPVSEDGWRVTRVFFAPHLARVCVIIDSGERRRIFARGADDRDYSEINLPDPSLIVSGVAVPVRASTAFFHASVANERGGSNSLGVLRVDFETMTAALLPNPKPRSDESRTWISELLGASEDGTRLWVLSAHQTVPRSDGGWTVGYRVCTFEVETGNLTTITQLRTSFA